MNVKFTQLGMDGIIRNTGIYQVPTGSTIEKIRQKLERVSDYPVRLWTEKDGSANWFIDINFTWTKNISQ